MADQQVSLRPGTRAQTEALMGHAVPRTPVEQEARFWNRIEPDQRAFHDRLLADLVNQARLGRISQADVRRMIKERFGSDPTIPPMEVFREQIQQQLPTDRRELKRMNWPRNRAFD